MPRGRVRKGLDEFDRMQRDRAAAEQSRGYVNEVNEIPDSNARKRAKALGIDLPGPSEAMTPQQKKTYIAGRIMGEVRGQLGAFTGGTSKDITGSIKKVSANIRRNQSTGLRLSGMPEGFTQLPSEGKMESELASGKTKLTPGQRTVVKMTGLEQTMGNIKNRQAARATGRAAAKVRRQLSQSVINMIESSGLDKSQRAEAYRVAGGSAMRRDLPKDMRGPAPMRGSRSQSEPVDPSVDRSIIRRVQVVPKSKFEPMTGKPDVPSVFMKAFKGLIGGGAVAAGLSKQGATVAHAGNMLPGGDAAKMDTLTQVGNAVIAGNKRKANEIALASSLKSRNYTSRQKKAMVQKYNRNIGIKPKAASRSVRAK